MSRYETYPCEQCGRKITQGYHTKIGVVCGRCYKNQDVWLDSVIKLGDQK